MTKTLEDCSTDAHEALETARLLVGDTERALWADVDELNRNEQHSAAADAHDALHEYVGHLRVHTREHGDRWHEDVVGGHEFPDETTLPVTLADIDEWYQQKYRDFFSQRTHSVHLPVAYVRELLRQADAVAVEEGFIEEPERRTAGT